ncbi:MAG: DUF4347 domain-containing protein, partial [Anaerolineales bacterium]|nr:DUF4347 domain-containing protein [Anaerolineales bacterium]
PPVDDGHSDWQDISDELALLKDFTPPAVTSPEELVFIDPGVEDVQTLLAGISSEAEVVFLEPDRDGVLQISEILSQYSGIEAIHILSHGEAGSFSLGGTELSSDTISEYASHLQSWAASLTENADILIYSCNVAANEAGVAFVAELSALTGADVAASEDLTGSAAEGGDWELEVSTGAIEAGNVVAAPDAADYEHVLAAPSVTAGATLNFTEGDGATAIDATITVTDADSTNLQSATITITGNYAIGQDVLEFTDQSGISGSWDALNGKLTLTGTSLVANYQAALRSVSYNNTSDNPSTADRFVGFSANDGTDNSNTAFSQINVADSNDAPVVTAGATLNFTEGDPAAVIDNTITLSDVDTTTIASATVTISANYANGKDVLAFTNTANITGNWTAATGILTLTGADTIAAYQTALRSITYANTGGSDPESGDRTITWVVNDGTDNSTGVTSTVAMTVVNDIPVLTAGATLNYTENDVAAVIDNTITVADADHANMSSATVTISTGYENGKDVLSFTNMGNITGSWDAGTAVLTLSGSDTKANYQTALRSVKYANSSDDPTAGNRTITWVANDGTDTSTGVTSTVSVTVANDAPTVTAGGTLNYSENDSATPIDTGIIVTDPDTTTSASATVTISAGYVNGQDVLAFTNTANITGNWTAATGILTLTGVDTVANYQAALRTVTYVNSDGDNPTSGNRTITWVVNDGADASTGVTSTVAMAAVNDASVVTAGATLNFTEGDAATLIDNTITIADVDDANIESATVTVSSGYENGKDVLTFVDTGNITGSWTAATGILTLTGSDTKANYQTALRSVKYQNASDAPAAGNRTITWVVNDGDDNSTAVTSTVSVTAVNDPPVVAAGGTLNYTENNAATAIDTGVTVADADNTNIQNATVSISGNFVIGQDVLSFTDTANITGSWDGGTGVLTLTGADTVANYQAALRTVKYENTSDDPNTTGRTISWVANDGADNSSTVTSTVTVAAANDAPVVAAGGTLAFTEHDAATVIDNSITISDADTANIASATVTISAGYVNGEDVLAFTN